MIVRITSIGLARRLRGLLEGKVAALRRSGADLATHASAAGWAAEVREDHRVARVPPLHELACALAEINDRAAIGDLYKTPSRAERHPTLELLNG